MGFFTRESKTYARVLLALTKTTGRRECGSAARTRDQWVHGH